MCPDLLTTGTVEAAEDVQRVVELTIGNNDILLCRRNTGKGDIRKWNSPQNVGFGREAVRKPRHKAVAVRPPPTGPAALLRVSSLGRYFVFFCAAIGMKPCLVSSASSKLA